MLQQRPAVRDSIAKWRVKHRLNTVFFAACTAVAMFFFSFFHGHWEWKANQHGLRSLLWPLKAWIIIHLVRSQMAFVWKTLCGSTRPGSVRVGVSLGGWSGLQGCFSAQKQCATAILGFHVTMKPHFFAFPVAEGRWSIQSRSWGLARSLRWTVSGYAVDF